MRHTQVIVDVYNGDVYTGRKERPLRRIPGIGWGVKIRGLVYPVGADNRVNISGDGYDPDDCPVAGPSELPSDPSTWHIDRSGYYTYLLFDADDSEVETLVEEIRDAGRRAGFEVLLYGRSRKPADNGRQYGWFARVATPNNGDVALPATQPACPGPLALPHGKREANAVADAVLPGSSAQVTVPSAIRHHPSGPVALTHVAAGTTEGASTQQHLTRGAPVDDTEAPDAIDRAEADQVDERIRSLEAEILKHQEARRAAETGFDEAADENRKLLEDREDLESEKLKLEEQLATMRIQKDRSQQFAQDQMQLVRDVFLARIEWVQGADDVLHELADPRPVLTRLRQLNEGDDSVRRTKVVGSRDWWEVRFSTGRDDDGRLYYRSARTLSGNKLHVLLGYKGTQSRDIERLRNMPTE